MRDISRARHALGLATRRDLKNIAYWMAVIDLFEPEFRTLLQTLSVPISEKAQHLSRKAIVRLKSEARRRGIDPITGKPILPTTNREEPKPTAFEWRITGHVRELRWLQADEVIGIHEELVEDFSSTQDPIEPPGVRAQSLIESAVFRPQTALGGVLKYPTVEMSAAALLHSLIHDHPFHNGNKRTALVSVLVFLDENGFFPEFDQDEAFKFILDIAQHRIAIPEPGSIADRETLAIVAWLSNHCRILEKGNRSVPFRRLRRILAEYACVLNSPSHGKIEITRERVSSGRFLKRRTTLRTQASYGGEGRDVSKKVVKKIREELELDDLHGVDTRAFYSKGPIQTTEFIARYRKTLRRLARF